MGGYGSTRWSSHCRCTTVEESLGLPTTHIAAGLSAVADGAAGASGHLFWKRNSQVTSSISYRIERRGAQPIVRLIYTTTRANGEKIDSDYPVRVASTQPHFGGWRWWWICPNVTCGRRVGKLYSPPGAIYFACRHCYRLSYESCNESHKYDSLWKRLGFGVEVGRLLERRYRGR